MTQFASAVGWLVLSPIALLTNVIAIVIVCHYRTQFHGTDVAFISLFVSMAMHALLVIPIPAALALNDEGWLRSELCSFYVWLVLCVRMSELLATVIMNIHWMCVLRFTSGQEVYSSATVIKILVIVAWFAAVVTGLVPVTGPSFYTYYEETSSLKVVQGAGAGGGLLGVNSSTAQYARVVRGECKFLPQGLGTSFVLFFILVTLAAVVISLVASADTLAVFRYMKRTAVDKYKAGRFYLPSSSLVNSTTAGPAGGGTNQNTGGAAVALRGEVDSHHRNAAVAAAAASTTSGGRGGGGAGGGAGGHWASLRNGRENNGEVATVVGRNGRVPGDPATWPQGPAGSSGESLSNLSLIHI